MKEADVVRYSKRKWFPTAPWSVELRNFTQVTFCSNLSMQVVSVYVCFNIKETASAVDTYKVPNKTCGCGVSGLCVLIHGKVTNKSRSSIYGADAPFLLGFTSHGALGLTTLRQVNLKPPPGKFFSAKAPILEQELH